MLKISSASVINPGNSGIPACRTIMYENEFLALKNSKSFYFISFQTKHIRLGLLRIQYLEQRLGMEYRIQSNSNHWIAIGRCRKNFWRRPFQCLGDQKLREFVAHSINIPYLLSLIRKVERLLVACEERLAKAFQVHNLAWVRKLNNFEKAIKS